MVISYTIRNLYKFFIKEGNFMKRVSLKATKTRNLNKKRKRLLRDRGITTKDMEIAIRESGGFITKAARMLNISIGTLQNYIKTKSTLREALFETRAEFVDEAEASLRELVRAKNLTATIFTLKCLAQDRGYIDVPKTGRSEDMPIYIKFVPATPQVQLPKATIVVGKNEEKIAKAEAKVLKLTKKNVDEMVDGTIIEDVENMSDLELDEDKLGKF